MRDTLDQSPECASIAPILRLQSVSFHASGRALIRDLDLRIRPGRRTVILGANGAGKSLTLRLLHGLLRPSSGQVLWQNAPMSRQDRNAQAMVFQRPVMLRRSVRANLRFALSVRGFTGADRATREQRALQQARLTDLAHRPARVLSGGEQQRLAVARALAAAPQVLFLDEPTASLDPASTHAVEDMVRQAHAAGVTIVMVTHDQGQARRLADDVIFMHAGQVAEAGPAAQVLHHPQSGPAGAWLDGRLYLDPPTG